MATNIKNPAEITMCDGGELPWVDEIRYIGVFIIRGAKFKCSIDKAKHSFYRAANGIFVPKSVDWLLRKLWFNFSQMFAYFTVCSRCICNLDKRSMQSLDTFNRFL